MSVPFAIAAGEQWSSVVALAVRRSATPQATASNSLPVVVEHVSAPGSHMNDGLLRRRTKPYFTAHPRDLQPRSPNQITRRIASVPAELFIADYLPEVPLTGSSKHSKIIDILSYQSCILRSFAVEESIS